MHKVGRNLTHIHQVLDLRDGDLGRRCHHGIEIARRLAKHQVAPLVALPGLYKGEVRVEGALQNVPAAVELACFLAFGDRRAEAGRRVERRDAGAGGADALGQRSLRIQLQLHGAGEHHLLESLVFADVATDVLPHLAVADQHTQAEIVHSDVVRDGGEVLDARASDGGDQVLRYAAQPEAAEHDHGAVVDVADGLLSIRYDLIHDFRLEDK